MHAMPLDRDEPLLITRAGYEHLRSQLARLCEEARPQLSERLRQARDEGDLADNPALYEALEEQAQLEQQIARVEAQLACARIAEPTGDGRAGVGSWVRLRDLQTRKVFEYELVAGIEADVANGRVSVEAPVGRALVGTAGGESVEVDTPRGSLRLEVLQVDATPAREAA
jgi:transcription elongation factor GreA